MELSHLVYKIQTRVYNPRPPFADMVSDWTVSCLGRAGLDTSLFSGVCARRGELIYRQRYPLDANHAIRACSGGHRPTLCGAEEPYPTLLYMGSFLRSPNLSFP